jgi:hypothetical protein
LSGSTIGGAIGAVVGFWIGGPQGAQYGWMIGSAVGGYVDPTQVFGPRLQDTRGQTSAVGGAIPRAWGTAPVPGNIIWQQPGVTEHKHTDDGKGSGTEQITYTYTRSYAIMFHLGEIAGVLQIKRNGKIVYDVRDDDTLLAEYEASLGPVDDLSGYFERIRLQHAMNSRWINKCTIYTGTQTQEPDPTIEAYLGVGNAPAYRGRAYFVVTDDETQAGEIAQYEVIVAACGTVNNVLGGAEWVIGFDAPASVELSPDGTTWPNDGVIPSAAWQPNGSSYAATHEDSVLLITPSPTAETNAAVFSSDGGATFSACTGLPIDASAGDCLYAGGYWHVASDDTVKRSANGVDYSAVGTAPDVFALTVFSGSLYGIGNSNNIYKANLSGDSWEADSPPSFVSGASSSAFRLHSSPSELGAVGVQSGSFGGGGLDDARCHIHSKSGGVWTEHANPFSDVLDTNVFRPCIHYAEGLSLWVVIFHNRVAYGSSLSSLTLSAHVFPNLPTNVSSDNNKIIVCGLGGMLEWTVDGEEWEVISDGPAFPIYAIAPFWDGLGTPLPDAPGWYINSDGSTSGPSYSTLTPCSTTTVGEIVADVCQLSGLTADEYDVSQLTDTLDGFVVARETDAASVIESLRPVGMFDPAEWDGKLRFIKRGGTAVGSINGDDLVERDGDAVEREMVQEVELLRKVSVGYLDTQAAWAPNTQAWERTVGTINARGESVVEVTAVMDADQAATIAKRKGLTAWGEPEKQKLSLLSLRHAKYTPTDILNYTDADAEIHQLRLMQIEDDSGIREIESSLNCAEAYNATATGVAPKPPTITDVTVRGPTYAVFMNLPSLRTQDNVPGVTIGACGMMAGWQGAAILLSEDDGVSYQQITTFTQPTAMGRLTAACTDSSEPISVRMEEGALSSITEAQLALRHNAFAIVTDDVAELGQFQTATATATDQYDLTGTVRGALETEATTHSVGDPFVMVAAAQFVPLDISLAGRTLYFKAVTFGTSQDAAEAIPFVFNPLFTSITVSNLTVGGEAITVDGQPIFVVT